MYFLLPAHARALALDALVACDSGRTFNKGCLEDNASRAAEERETHWSQLFLIKNVQ